MISKQKLFLIWLVVQVAVLGGWASTHEWQRQHAPRVLLRLTPVDPQDIVRGRYQWISFEIENIPSTVVKESGINHEKWNYGQKPLWLVLKKGSNEWYEVASIHEDCPVGNEPVIHSTYSSPWSRWDSDLKKSTELGIRVSIGIDRYFIPANHYDLPRGTNHVICGEVSVTRSGTAQLERLVVDGKPY